MSSLLKLSQSFLEKSEPKYSGFIFYCPEDNTVFLLKRTSKTTNPNLWSLPGGSMNGSEKPLEGALREVKEETGSIPKHEIVDSLLQGQYMNYIAIVDKKTKDAWKPKLDWENVNWKWFTIESMPDELHPGLIRTLKQIVIDRLANK